MAQFQIAYNEVTNNPRPYEVHAAGCRHITMGLNEDWRKRKYAYARTVEAESGAAAVAEFEAGNEGCYARVGPCAKGA